MRLKEDVDATDVSPVLWCMLGIVAYSHRIWLNEELWITGLRYTPRVWSSRHSPEAPALVTAADIRRWYLDAEEAADPFCRQLQVMWGAWLGVCLEPEWLSPEQIELRGGLKFIDPHAHLELKRDDWPRVL